MSHDAKEFNSLLQRISQSATYGTFCERVYGRDLSQFNALDEEQLQFLIKKVKMLRPLSMLDLGCGLGRISKFLAENTDAAVVGIDFADEIIAELSIRYQACPTLNFRVGDLNSLPYVGNTELVLAIDTLCFADDIEEMIEDLRGQLTSNGSVIIFHSYRNKADGATIPLNPSDCSVGKALTKAGFKFEIHDFTESEKRLWERAMIVAEKLRRSFENEGNHSTCEARIWEAERNLRWILEGGYRRTMFIAKLL